MTEPLYCLGSFSYTQYSTAFMGAFLASLGMRCFVIEHVAAFGADKEREAFIPCRNKFKGKLLKDQ
jgi:uncharacterized RDD family membrane protein YckC